MWKEGSLYIKQQVIHYWIEYFDKPSIDGIEEGRISKLELCREGMVIADYDKRWNLEPADEAAEIAIAILLMEHS